MKKRKEKLVSTKCCCSIW